MSRTINIAKDFSRYPAGRYLTDGPYPGQKFRDELLAPALEQGEVELVIDGVAGLPSSFLEEALGGLVRESGMRLHELRRKLKITAITGRMAGYVEQAWRYIEDADQRLAAG